MKKTLIVSLIAVVLSSLAGCNKPSSTDKPTTSALEPVLNPSGFDPEFEGVLKRSEDHFKSNGFKPLANHCWDYTTARKCIALYAKAGNGSHASSADIGGFFAEYNHTSKQWDVKAESLAFSENGTWGEAPIPTFVKLGPDRYGFVMTTGFTQGGFYDELLTLYGVNGKGIIEMLRLPIAYDNGMTGEEESGLYEVQVMLSQVIDPAKEFYDLKATLTVKGKYDLENNQELTKLFGKAKEVMLAFHNGEYIPEGETTGK